jgi:hypothetical protein
MTTDDIPAGFVLLAAYDEREGDEHKSGPKGDYARLLYELGKDKPSIRAFKQRGQWVACKKDVEEFLVNLHRPAAESITKRGGAAKTAPGYVSIDGTQAEKLFSLLGRIACALEELASRPDHGPDGECGGDEPASR